MPSGVLLEGPDPKSRPALKQVAEPRHSPSPGPRTRGTRTCKLPLEASAAPVSQGTSSSRNAGGSESGSAHPRSPWDLEQLQDQKLCALVAHKVLILPPGMDSCPCRGLQPPPGLR